MLQQIKVSLAFVICRLSSSTSSSFFFFFFFSSLSLSLSLSIYIYIYIFFFFFNFIYVLYIWFEKNILKVEFLINKTPSNTDLLSKTTRYQQRFWNICWKLSNLCMLYLFLLMIYLFSFGYWKNLWLNALHFFFFCGYMPCLYRLCIFPCSSHLFNLWQKIVQPPFLCSNHFGLRSDFLSLSMIWNACGTENY